MNLSLHLLQERFEHLSCRGFQESLRLVVILFADTFPGEELRCLVGEHVAVVVDDVVLLRSILMRDIFQELLKDLLWDFGLSERYFLDGFAIGSSFGSIVADASSEVVLSAEDNERSVVDCIDLLADDHHAHGASHSHGDVIDK